MGADVHALMKDADDLDQAVVRDAEEQEVRADGVFR